MTNTKTKLCPAPSMSVFIDLVWLSANMVFLLFVFYGFCVVFCSVFLLCSCAPSQPAFLHTSALYHLCSPSTVPSTLPSVSAPSLLSCFSPTHFPHLCFSTSLPLHLILFDSSVCKCIMGVVDFLPFEQKGISHLFHARAIVTSFSCI